MLDLVRASLDADKAENVVAIDLAGRSSFVEAMVIASGAVARHVGAMADHLAEKLKREGLRPQVEGFPACDWVLLDLGSIVVHLFRPEVRAFYNLEKMWGEGPATARQTAADGDSAAESPRWTWTPDHGSESSAP